MVDTPVLTGKTAVITGASQGIGRAIAVTLARSGVRCLLIARHAERLREVTAACEQEGAPARAIVCDLLDGQRCKEVIESIGETTAGLDFVVNNAGLYKIGPFARGSADADERLLETNVTAVWNVCRAALPYLVASKQGAIVNIASIAGVRPLANEAVYASTKHAIVGFTHALFQEARESGVKVSAVCPGLVATQMAENRGADLDKAIRPQDVAHAVHYILASSPRVCPTQICLEPQRDPMLR